jgi:hypothetical protein
VSFPLTFRDGLARSRPLETPRGEVLTPGRYAVYVVDAPDSEQSESARAFLASLPEESAQRGTARLPAGARGNHRLVWTTEVTFAPSGVTDPFQ